MCAFCVKQAGNQERAVSLWATWLKTEVRGHLFHRQPPTVCGLEASQSPNEPSRPPYQWSLGGARGQPSPRMVGANGGSTEVPGAKNMIFSKVVPRPLAMLNQVLSAHFEPVVPRFRAPKITKCLENGPFLEQKLVKNGSKTHFSKSDLGTFRARPKIPKCLKNGPFWEQTRIGPKILGQ